MRYPVKLSESLNLYPPLAGRPQASPPEGAWQADMLIEPRKKLTPPPHGDADAPDTGAVPVTEGMKPAVNPTLRAIALAVCIVFSGLVWAALVFLF